MTDAAGLSDEAEVELTIIAVPDATTLVVEPVLLAPGRLLPAVRARLVVTETAVPLPGRTVTFTAGTVALCTATTDANGYARCDLAALLTALLRLGYQAAYAGEFDYLPSDGDSGLLR